MLNLSLKKLLTKPNLMKSSNDSIDKIYQLNLLRQAKNNGDASVLEHQIDNMVYELYKLTP